MYISSQGKSLDQLTHAEIKKSSKAPQDLPTAAQQKQQFNAGILEANANISVTSGNKSLALLYKTALEGINDVLKETLGDNAIQTSYDAGVDTSPEATAERIVSQSTGFFALYQQNNPDLDEKESLSRFSDIIRGGIEQGFEEARDILTSLSVLEGKIASDIDKTYDLVQEGLNSFFDNYSAPDQTDDEADATNIKDN